MHRRQFLATALAASVTSPLPRGSRAAAPPAPGLADLTLAEASELVRRRLVSPVELVRACLARVERHDDTITAFVTVTGTQALAEARQAEADIKAGRRIGPLHGLPIGLKDNLDTAGLRTTAGNGRLKFRVPKEDGAVVRRLRAAGAISVGKLNMNSMAIGYDSVNSFVGPVRNPWSPDRIAGGSSGGSGASVAAGMCLASLGTDTGGSVRHPAACCGLVGLKPTHGRVSLRGVVLLVESLDCVGPLARTALDCALMMQAIAGHDPKDRNSLDAPVDDYPRALRAPVKGLRLGRPKGHYFAGLDPEVRALVESAIGVLAKLTAGVEDVELPAQPNGGTLKQKRREAAEKAFQKVDVLVTPTVPHPPHEVKAALERRGPGGAGQNLAPFNRYGWPGLSMPCGFTKAGLPVGVQLVAGPLQEGRLLALAAAYERETGWHKRRPRLG